MTGGMSLGRTFGRQGPYCVSMLSTLHISSHLSFTMLGNHYYYTET
jgi:hypothetical protein